MAIAGFMWECACGQIERGEESPEECADCGKLDEFMKVPEELVEQREKDLVEKEMLNPGEEY
jgi:hypothetical protein